MPNVRKIKTLAIVGFLATIGLFENCTRGENELVNTYSAIAEDGKQSSRFGWIPKNPYEGDADPYRTSRFPKSGTSEAYLESVSDRAERRKSLRSAYRRRYYGFKSNPYARPSETTSPHKTSIECECGKDCMCPPLVCKRGDCKKNYVFVITAPAWCVPCKEINPLINELRDEGYLVYYFDVDKHPDLDAKFDVNGVPTFLIFDEGKEQARASGIVPKKWFTDRLVKVKDQIDEEKTNPYDELLEND